MFCELTMVDDSVGRCARGANTLEFDMLRTTAAAGDKLEPLRLPRAYRYEPATKSAERPCFAN